MIKNFEVSAEDEAKISIWMKEREAYTGAIGGQFSYQFIPTGIGVIFKVVDLVSRQELDLTDYDSW